MSENWNAVYQGRPYVNTTPDAGVVAFLERVKAEGKREVLDLGCGDGRHLIYLVNEGFNAAGMDYSLWGTQRTKEWLDKEGLSAELVCAEAAFLPWQAERFDAVLTFQVIHHQRMEMIRQSFTEVKRVLRPGGYFYAVVPHYPPGDWKDGHYDEIEEHTFMPTDGFEKGIPHHFYTEEELASELSGFEVLEVKVDERGKFYALVRKKI
jgi:cyclopropane fatty-acyl-phospholipid synthase-like methyltransferase